MAGAAVASGPGGHARAVGAVVARHEPTLSGRRRQRTTGQILVAAGPRLEVAETEAAAVAACHSGARVLAGESATTRAVTDGLVGAPLAHIVAHGRFRHDNPLWSTIELADGPLSVYELELLDHTPPVMVLASCDSGVGGPRGGDQLLGLSQTLLRMGTRSIVASVNLVPDDPTTTAALVALHEDLARGVEPSASLADTRVRRSAGRPGSGLLRDAGSELMVRADRVPRARQRVVNL